MFKNISSALDRRPHSCGSRGFTLVEVMIVVAIVAILSTIALPSYEAYIRKTRRTDAKNALLDLATRQEKYYSINNKYTPTLTDLGYSNANSSPVYSSGNSYYDLTVTANATTFKGMATPKGPQLKDAECYAFTLNNTGAKGNQNGATILSPDRCW